MTLYQIDIEKATVLNAANTVYWTNVYHVNVSDLAAATTAMNSIVNAEKAITYSSVGYQKARIRVAGSTGPGSLVVLSGTGAITSVGVSQLPLFCTTRVDFTPLVGRPSRKYLRGTLSETNTDQSNLTSTQITFVNTNYRDVLLTLGVFVDVDGEAFTGGLTLAPIQMRQLRRGSKKKVLP